jgi:hypothetical protein
VRICDRPTRELLDDAQRLRKHRLAASDIYEIAAGAAYRCANQAARRVETNTLDLERVERELIRRGRAILSDMNRISF